MTTSRVRSKIDVQMVTARQSDGGDRWKDFRQIERLSLELTQSYKHSLGKYSRFFVELENKRFFATGCPSCDKVYAPPRPLCPDCLQITEWVELSGKGTLETFSFLHYPPGSNEDVENLEAPYVLAYVLLDGASTLFPHLLQAPLESVRAGMRVRAHFVDGSVFHPIHLMHFVPLEE